MEQTTYLCKFDSEGRRTETLLSCELMDEERAQKIGDGYIEIVSDEWSYYVGNKGNGANGTGYIRGADGKPVDAPAYVPTKAERLSRLDTQYEADKAELSKYYVEAVLSGNTDAQTSIKAELNALTSKYDKNRAEIKEE